MVIWQAIILTSASIAMSRSSSIEATPFFLMRFFIIVVAAASTPGMAETRLGMPMCMPIIGISIAGLPSVVIFRSSFFFNSVRP